VRSQFKNFLEYFHGRLRLPTRRELCWGLASVPVLGILYVLVLIPFTPAISDIRKAGIDQPARILFADGKPLAEFKRDNREWVSLEEISPHVVDALISTEDRRFYQHHGIDVRRTIGAMLHTLEGQRQGGSTLTQQLARNLYPDAIGRAPTLTRKIKEAITALKIEAVYTKPEILETYLNTVPFLYNAFGIEMAARTYFGKSADRLDVLESATLVGMLKGNSYYNPVINPERALKRRNVVLAQMARFGRLEPKRLVALQAHPLKVDFERQTETPGPAPRFAREVRKWLIQWADQNDYNIYADGLVVYTTLDSRLQAYANRAVRFQASQLQQIADAEWSRRDVRSVVRDFVRETPEYRDAVKAGLDPDKAVAKLQKDRPFMQMLLRQKLKVQAGFLAMDPRTAEIRAWVGSTDFARDVFDHVRQARRQPGSTFKPFVYGAAFAHGARPDDRLPDVPVDFHLPGGEIWHPDDDEAPTGKPMTLRDALVHSNNIVSARLIEQVGVSRVARLAYAMGVRDSQLDEVPSLALGTSQVSLWEMVNAYSTIADDGAYRAPILVSRIEDRDGKVLAEFAPNPAQQALPRNADRTLLDVMRGVVDHGTGVGVRRRFGIRADVAGKTGTTQNNVDGWFILMHPELVAGAWVGFDDARVTSRNDYWGQGAHSALPMVGAFFRNALSSGVIDRHARFDTEIPEGLWSVFKARVGAWIKALRGDVQQEDVPQKVAHKPSRSARHSTTKPAVPETITVSEPSSISGSDIPAFSSGIEPADELPEVPVSDGSEVPRNGSSMPAGVSSPVQSAPALPVEDIRRSDRQKIVPLPGPSQPSVSESGPVQ